MRRKALKCCIMLALPLVAIGDSARGQKMRHCGRLTQIGVDVTHEHLSTRARLAAGRVVLLGEAFAVLVAQVPISFASPRRAHMPVVVPAVATVIAGGTGRGRHTCTCRMERRGRGETHARRRLRVRGARQARNASTVPPRRLTPSRKHSHRSGPCQLRTPAHALPAQRVVRAVWRGLRAPRGRRRASGAALSHHSRGSNFRCKAPGRACASPRHAALRGG